MNSVLNNLFGPLPKEYCNYFYIISIFFYVVLISFIILSLGYLIKNYNNLKDIKFILLIYGIQVIVSLFLSYFVNRLLYSMCVNSLH